MVLVVTLSISCSTVDCNSITFQPQRSMKLLVLYLTKTFVVEMLHYCNLLC